ncbi:MAG: hypothetical protein CMN30_04940 [Sandaracinus sp.]|nr:hypothetical protein [Sandaracinus sp.]
MQTRPLLLALAALVALAFPGCGEEREFTPCPIGDHDPVPDRVPQPEFTEALDLVFVVDDSGTMEAEQARLAAVLPAMVERLLPAVAPTRRGFRSLRLGVLTTDLGAPGACPNGQGDDALLQPSDAPGCDLALPWAEFWSGELPERPQCLLEGLGTGGCGFVQPLEALLKGLTPSTSDLRFGGWTTGHGDGPNAGFLRRDATWGVVILTDGDDCSAADPGLYDVASREYTATIDRRCTDHPEALHPIRRFVDGLRALRGEGPLVVSVIGGVPPALVGDQTPAGLRALLDSPAMQVVPGTDRRAACSTPDGDDAFPARRLVEFAAALGDGGGSTEVHSICEEDFGPALDSLASAALAAGAAAPLRCIWRSDAWLNARDCVIFEEAPGCASRPGRTPVDADECSIGPADATTPGFSIVDDPGCDWSGPAIVFTAGADPEPADPLFLQCGWVPSVGAPCDGAPDSCAGGVEPLACDPFSDTCQHRCDVDDDCDDGERCAAAGEPGLRFCERRDGVCPL